METAYAYALNENHEDKVTSMHDIWYLQKLATENYLKETEEALLNKQATDEPVIVYFSAFKDADNFEKKDKGYWDKTKTKTEEPEDDGNFSKSYLIKLLCEQYKNDAKRACFGVRKKLANALNNLANRLER